MKLYIIYFLILWYLYFYSNNDFEVEVECLKNRFQEKNYQDVIENNHRNPFDFYIFRIITAFLFFVFYLLIITEKIDFVSISTGILIAFIVYKGLYLYEYRKYQLQLTKACKEFPYYLNNLCILVNNNPVTNAIYESIELAPEMFKKDLAILVKEIYDGEKEGSLPFMNFSNKYRQIDDLPRIMMTLYTMKNYSSESDILLTSLNHLSNEKLNDANKLKFERNLDKQALMPWLGFMWIGFLVISLLLNFDLSIIGGF